MQESTIVLPEHRVRVFDPIEIYRTRVADRAIVYLDTNIWIDLRDAKTEEAERCREACLRAVDRGRAIFPVSYASVSEVLENPVEELRIQQADLMDALSLGVTFRNSTLVYALEGEAAYHFAFRGESIETRRQEAFTSLPDCLGDGQLTFPAGLRSADVERFLDHCRTGSHCSVRWLVDHQASKDVRDRHASVDSYCERMDAQREAQRAQLFQGGKVDRDAVAHDERIALFKSHVLPAMRRAGIAEHGLLGVIGFVSKFREDHGDGSRRRLREIFRAAAPALEVLAQIYARRALDVRRKTKKQDFWDNEHAGLAPVYADAFVTADGNLKEVLTLGERRPPGAKAKLLSSLNELEGWLVALAGSPNQGVVVASGPKKE